MMIEKMPSGAKNKTNVSETYPEIVRYWKEKGMPEQHIEILSCPSVEEDCLYLYGRFHSYCRTPAEWKMWKDLTEEEKPPKAKIRSVYLDDDLKHCY